MTADAPQVSLQPRVREPVRAWPALLLCCVVLLHTVLSQPAPQALSWVELLIAGGLAALVGVRRGFTVFTMTRPRTPRDVNAFDWGDRFAAISFLLLLWFGMLRAVTVGWPLGDVVRDVVPLMFLFLPLLINPQYLAHIATGPLTLFLAVGGSIFAWRYLSSIEIANGAWGQGIQGQSLAYLANSPLIAFTAVIGLLLPLYRWVGVPSVASFYPAVARPLTIVLSCLLVMAGCFCFLTMATAGQRAPLMLSLLAMVLGILWLGIGYGLRHALTARAQRRLVFLLPFLVFGGLGVWLLDVVPYSLIAGFIEKFRVVGDNARLAEWSAVWAQVGQEPWALIMGQGWGAHYHSPAVGDYYVGYTHGLLPYLLLKTGLLGWLALVLYTAGLVIWTRDAYRRQPFLTGLVMLAMAPAILSTVLFYTSYKFLGFGLLLLLIRALAVQPVTKDHPSPAE